MFKIMWREDYCSPWQVKKGLYKLSEATAIVNFLVDNGMKAQYSYVGGLQ